MLSKHWETVYEMPSIYTGGKITILNGYIFAINNFAIIIYDISNKKISKKISHVEHKNYNFFNYFYLEQ